MQRLVTRLSARMSTAALTTSHWRSATVVAPLRQRALSHRLFTVGTTPLRAASSARPVTLSTQPRVAVHAPSVSASSSAKSAKSSSGAASSGSLGKRNSDRVGTGIAVPIIDLSAFVSGSAEGKARVAAQIGEACERIGFMTVVGHGIPQGVVRGAWDATTAYFDLPVAEKERVPMTADYPYGYIGFANENLSRGYDGKRAAPDLKECFCIGPYNALSGMPAVRWPPAQPAIEAAWLAYYQAMEGLSASLLSLFALALRLPEQWFADKITRHRSAFRMLNYPPQEVAPLPGQIRAGEHTDYGTLTILKSDERVAGLQVLARDGLWYDVAPVRDSFVVNIGDLMQRWTNDRWVSTLHRVVNPAGQTITNERRQSMAFFHNLNGDAVVEAIPTCVSKESPAKYPPIEAWKHLIEKHEASTKGVKPK